MRTFTKLDERPSAARTQREEFYETPLGVGRLLLAGDLPLELELPDPARPAPASAESPSRWALQLQRYFAGERVVFDLDIAEYAAAHGLTTFEAAVFGALAAVPWGSVVSYRDLAAAAGHPNAYRATGSVMARNDLPVILPCHRVVKNDGRLGFYGDDPAWKARLLVWRASACDGTTGWHERRSLAPDQAACVSTELRVRRHHGPVRRRQVAGHGLLRGRRLVLRGQPAAAARADARRPLPP